jgi:hypothetical protein
MYGRVRADQPNTSPGSTVMRVTVPRPATCTVRATRPLTRTLSWVVSSPLRSRHARTGAWYSRAMVARFSLEASDRPEPNQVASMREANLAVSVMTKGSRSLVAGRWSLAIGPSVPCRGSVGQ